MQDSFAELLKHWLERRDLTPRAAACQLGVSHMTVYNWLRGNLPPNPRVPMLASALGLGADELASIVRRDRKRSRRSIQSSKHASSVASRASESTK